MKIRIVVLLSLIGFVAFSQEKDTTVVFKKRVLESTEVDFLASYYNQNGSKSVVSGGIGSEKLTDIASNIVVNMPINDDATLTIDLGISAYSSASSSNINPFNATGASGGSSPGYSSRWMNPVLLVASLGLSLIHSGVCLGRCGAGGVRHGVVGAGRQRLPDGDRL